MEGKGHRAKDDRLSRLKSIWFGFANVATVIGLVSILDDLKAWASIVTTALNSITAVAPPIGAVLQALGSLLHGLVSTYRSVVHEPVVRALAALDLSIPPLAIDVVLVFFFYTAGLLRIEAYLSRRSDRVHLIQTLIDLGATRKEAYELAHDFLNLDNDADKRSEWKEVRYIELLKILNRLGFSPMGFRGLYDRHLRPSGTYANHDERDRLGKRLFLVISALAVFVLIMLIVEAATSPKSGPVSQPAAKLTGTATRIAAYSLPCPLATECALHRAASNSRFAGVNTAGTSPDPERAVADDWIGIPPSSRLCL